MAVRLQGVGIRVYGKGYRDRTVVGRTDVAFSSCPCAIDWALEVSTSEGVRRPVSPSTFVRVRVRVRVGVGVRVGGGGGRGRRRQG